MKVVTDIKKSDLFWMNNHVYLTSPGTRNIGIYAWLAMSGMYFYNGGWDADFGRILLNLIVLLGWALLIYGAFYILSALTVLGSSSNSYGTLGKHTYEVKDDGFVEATDVNETFTKWEGIHDVVKTKNYLYIKQTPLLVHIIPLRSFSDETVFEEFFSKIKSGYETASNQGH